MKLLLNYKGVNKILPKVESYELILSFIQQNFTILPKNFGLFYIDSDGDSICLGSQLDVQTMLETINKDHLKVYIKDMDYNLSEEKKEEATLEKKDKILPEKKDEEIKKENAEEAKKESQESGVEENQWGKKCWKWKHGEGKKWKQKFEDKVAKLVDERIDALIPCIIKKIESKDLQSKSEVQKDKTLHQVKCTGCGIEPIYGIRYKCTECALFNFCENCEASVVHEHNMIKMKNVEKPPQVSDEESEEKKKNHCHWKGWKHPFKKMMQEKMNFFQGMMPSPPFEGKHPGFEHPPFAHENHPHRRRGQFSHPPPPPHSFGFFDIFKKENSFEKPEEKEEKIEWKQEKKEEDCLIPITNKCFKMCENFGGEPMEYREFVSENKDMKVNELIEKYLEKNSEVKVPASFEEKIEKKTQKLAFYFNEPKENFEQVAKKNPSMNFKNLVKTIKEMRENKDEPAEKKEEEIEEKRTLKTEAVEECESKVEEEGLFKAKRTNCLETMNDLFGRQNFFEHLKFFNENSELSQEKIIQKYIQKITK